MWAYMRDHMCACVRVCACVSVRVHMWVISGLSIHYGCLLTIIHAYFIDLWNHLNFFYVGLYLCFYSQVTWRNLEQMITRFNCDHWFSLTRGAMWLHLIRRWFVLRWFNLTHSFGELYRSRLNAPDGLTSIARWRSNGGR